MLSQAQRTAILELSAKGVAKREIARVRKVISLRAGRGAAARHLSPRSRSGRSEIQGTDRFLAAVGEAAR